MCDNELWISPIHLDKIFHRWLVENDTSARLADYQGKPYSALWFSRKSPCSVEFENFLWENGGLIFQYGKKRYIRFLSLEQKTWFILKYL